MEDGTETTRPESEGLLLTLGAPICSIEEFRAIRPKGRIVLTSGGYDPIHPGHISSFMESRKRASEMTTQRLHVVVRRFGPRPGILNISTGQHGRALPTTSCACVVISLALSRKFGDFLVVVVNGDSFLTAKKGRPFQDLQTRCLIVSSIRWVDFVVPFEVEGDNTVSEALRGIRPDIFTKGGDRVDVSTIPEWNVCRELMIEVQVGVGASKLWSSSWFLSAWRR